MQLLKNKSNENNTHLGKTIVNFLYLALSSLISTVCPFIIRTLLITKLGDDYLGLNSFFLSFIGILNVAELGLDSAIVFYMYKPYASKDMNTVNALLYVYKKFYFFVGIFVLCVGLILTPFFKYFIKGGYPNINIYIIYFVFLAQAVSSYLFASYKSAVLKVTECIDIESRIVSAANLTMYLLQIIVLITIQNYYFFVFLLLADTIAITIVRTLYVNKNFPEFKCLKSNTNIPKKDFFSKILGLSFSRIRKISRYSIDGICLSAFVGLKALARYQSYFSVFLLPNVILYTVDNSVKHGIGIFFAEENSLDSKYNFFSDFTFIYLWIVSFCTIALGCLYQNFIIIWIGDDFLLSNIEMFLFTILFFFTGMSGILLIIRDITGMWYEERFCAISETIFNIIGDVILVRYLGIAGILLVSIISIAFITIPYNVVLIHKKYFTKSSILYIIKLFMYTVITGIVFFITFSICQLIVISFLGLVIRGLICIIIPNILLFLFYYIFQKGYIKHTFELTRRILSSR